MGFNTTIFILNDRLGDIERHKDQFVEDIVREAGGGGYHGPKDTVGQTVIMPTEHADFPRLYGTQHNTIVDLNPYCKETLRLLETKYTREFVKSLVKDAEFYLKGLKKEIKAAEERAKE